MYQDIRDILTDLNAEYEPFLNGFVHRGVLRATKWIEEHHINDILDFLQKYECSNFYCVGHSLGILMPLLLNSRGRDGGTLNHDYKI